MESFNDRLRFIRKEVLHLTGMELAESLKYNQATVSNLENGKPPYNNIESAAKYIRNICGQYNISEHWIRTGEGEIFVQSAEVSPRDTAIEYLYSVISSLDPEQQEEVVAFIQGLAARFSREKKNTSIANAGAGDIIVPLRKAG